MKVEVGNVVMFFGCNYLIYRSLVLVCGIVRSRGKYSVPLPAIKLEKV